MATTSAKLPIFLDTNILIRANVSTATFHQEALSAIQGLRRKGTTLWISRQVLREYMANVSREQTFMKPLPAQVIAERINYFECRLMVTDDNAEVTANLIALLTSIPIGGKQIHDAYIVATMQVHKVGRLLTLNTIDFTRFAIPITVLSLAGVPQVLQE